MHYDDQEDDYDYDDDGTYNRLSEINTTTGCRKKTRQI